MNILFISDLNGDLTKGPNNSVPKQVEAQSKIDDVLWLNLQPSNLEMWHGFDFYMGTNEKNISLEKLDSPFSSPDCIVFEGLYEYPFNRIAIEAMRNGIPYVIVPRSAMTDCAQKQKRLKKFLGNTVFFSEFVRKATAIQFLTDAEMEQSVRWRNKYSFVIPNGIDLPPCGCSKITNARKGIKAAYIGRLDIYQKGIDLLLDACAIKQKELRSNGFSLELYGPDFNGSLTVIEDEIRKADIEDMVFLRGPVFGEEKASVLSESDMFVMASRFEGFSMGLVEALAFGLPSVVSVGTNIAEEIEAAGAGWNAGSTVESLANTLVIASSAQLRGRKVENARKFASRYRWDAIADRTHDVLTEITGIKE